MSHTFVKLDALPVAQQFARRMLDLGVSCDPRHVGVALSGGPDSMALARLVSWFFKSKTDHVNSGKPWAFIVDHQLRPESSSEASKVATWAGALGFQSRVLLCDWGGAPPTAGKKMNAAREARYTMLLGASSQHGVRHLLLGHHADDQAETFLLRLSRASGLNGLACMPDYSVRSVDAADSYDSSARQVRLIRPLLHTSKQDLYHICRLCDVPWVEDPTNVDPAYQRAAIRGLLTASATCDILKVSEACRLCSRLLKEQSSDLLDHALVELQPGVSAVIRSAPFTHTASRHIAQEALSALLQHVSGSVYPPRSRTVALLLCRLSKGGMRGSFAVRGVTVRAVKGSKGQLISVVREGSV